MNRAMHRFFFFKKNGFSLIEVLITLILITIGVVTISRAFSTGLFASTDIENVDLALNIVQAKMEQIKNTAFASLADSGPTADSNFSRFNVTVNVSEGQDPMQVAVTVSWSVKGGQNSIILTTLVANL